MKITQSIDIFEAYREMRRIAGEMNACEYAEEYQYAENALERLLGLCEKYASIQREILEIEPRFVWLWCYYNSLHKPIERPTISDLLQSFDDMGA